MWQAYTDPAQIPKWWANTTVDKLDVRVDGVWRFVSKEPGGKEHAFNGVHKVVDEPNKIVRTFEYEPYAGHVLEETVVFESQPDGKTRVLTTSRYANVEDLEGMVGMGMERGAADGLERLAKLVEK